MLDMQQQVPRTSTSTSAASVQTKQHRSRRRKRAATGAAAAQGSAHGAAQTSVAEPGISSDDDDQVQSSKSVFAPLTQCACTAPEQRERDLARAMCLRRGLEGMYYAGAISLWIRVRAHYSALQLSAAVLQQHLAIALNLTLKYCGPAWVAWNGSRLCRIREDWPEATASSVAAAELHMSQLLGWAFF